MSTGRRVCARRLQKNAFFRSTSGIALGWRVKVQANDESLKFPHLERMPTQHLSRLPYGRLVIRALNAPDRDELLVHMPNRIDAVLRHDTFGPLWMAYRRRKRCQGLSRSEHNGNKQCPLKRLNFDLLPRCITIKDPLVDLAEARKQAQIAHDKHFENRVAPI